MGKWSENDTVLCLGKNHQEKAIWNIPWWYPGNNWLLITATLVISAITQTQRMYFSYLRIVPNTMIVMIKSKQRIPRATAMRREGPENSLNKEEKVIIRIEEYI